MSVADVDDLASGFRATWEDLTPAEAREALPEPAPTGGRMRSAPPPALDALPPPPGAPVLAPPSSSSRPLPAAPDEVSYPSTPRYSPKALAGVGVGALVIGGLIALLTAGNDADAPEEETAVAAAEPTPTAEPVQAAEAEAEPEPEPEPAAEPEPEPAMVHLRIRTKPKEASLLVNGAPVSNPYEAEVERSEEDAVRVRATAPGYRSASATLRPDQDREATLTLVRDAPRRKASRRRRHRAARRARPKRERRRAPQGTFVSDNPY